MTCAKIPPKRTLGRSSMDSQFDSSRHATYENAALSEVGGRKPREQYLALEPDLFVRAVAIRFPL